MRSSTGTTAMIARDMSDGVLAYFGYPYAQEDDAEQAVRAALALVDAVANIRTDPRRRTAGSHWHCDGHRRYERSR